MMKYRELQKLFDNLEEKYYQLLGEKAEADYELAQTKASMNHVLEQDAEIRELHESVRRLKHDMKNHFMVIASYLNERDCEAAKQYTSEILDKLNAVHSYIETGNSLLNHILNEKLNTARQQGISVKAEIENLSFSKMESIDFSAMLSNLLDNAVEACAEEKEPELYVKISRKRGYETVLVKNKITQSVLQDNPTLKSTKSEKEFHGLGTGQLRLIAKKYGGMCDFYEEDGWFCACTFIPV